jgi:Fe-S-cluster containining protein
MVLTPEEYARMKRYADRHRIKFDVAPLTRSPFGVIILYQFRQDVCPFLHPKRKTCSVYAIRPTVCRMFPIHPFAVFRCDYLEADKRRAPGSPVAVTEDMKAAANYYARVIQPIVEAAAWVYNLNTGWERMGRQRPIVQRLI